MEAASAECSPSQKTDPALSSASWTSSVSEGGSACHRAARSEWASVNNSNNNINQAISAEQLLEFLADLLLETRPDALNTGPDFHYNVNDAIDILPKLQTGLDVNVR